MLLQQWEEEASRFLNLKYWNVIVYPTRQAVLPDFWKKWETDVEKAKDVTTILIVSHNVSLSVNIHVLLLILLVAEV